MKAFVSNLNRLLEQSHVTKRELSKAIGLSERMIQYYITGSKHPTIDVALAMSDFFGITLDDLLRAGESNSADHTDVAIKHKDVLRLIRMIDEASLKEREAIHTIVELYLNREEAEK